MKKILLTAFVAIVATTTFAQRTIDWSVTSIVSPTELQSTSTGTSITLDVTLTNLGTDSVFVGDTIYIQWAVANTNNQVIAGLIYPGPTTDKYAIQLARKNMGINDTMRYIGTFNTTIGVYPSANVKVFFTSLIVNRKKGLNFETSIVNNSLNKQIVWYNIQRWPVSIAQVSNNNAFNIFPNPVTENANITLKIIDLSANVEISIIDAIGKEVFTNSYNNNEAITINTKNFTSGVYFVKVKNGSQNSTSKLIVE